MEYIFVIALFIVLALFMGVFDGPSPEDRLLQLMDRSQDQDIREAAAHLTISSYKNMKEYHIRQIEELEAKVERRKKK